LRKLQSSTALASLIVFCTGVVHHYFQLPCLSISISNFTIASDYPLLPEPPPNASKHKIRRFEHSTHTAADFRYFVSNYPRGVLPGTLYMLKLISVQNIKEGTLYEFSPADATTISECYTSLIKLSTYMFILQRILANSKDYIKSFSKPAEALQSY
jgi:hypothetical protein